MDSLLEKGNWTTRLLSIRKAGRKKYLEWYFVGIYKTAQEAYFRGNKFVMDNEEIFKEQSCGLVPERLIIENMRYGGFYPTSNKEQIILDFIPDQNGPFMDTCGITRASYMLKRVKDLKDLLDMSTTSPDGVGLVTWAWK